MPTRFCRGAVLRTRCHAVCLERDAVLTRLVFLRSPLSSPSYHASSVECYLSTEAVPPPVVRSVPNHEKDSAGAAVPSSPIVNGSRPYI